MNKKKSNKAMMPLKIILNLVIMALLFYMVLTAFFPKAAERLLPIRHYVIVSESMEPDILKGDIIVVKNPNYNSLKVDDVISFYVDTNLDGDKEIVTHYIYSIDVDGSGERVYKTINANKESPDSWVLQDNDIIGQYVFMMPKIGKFLLFTQSRIGRLALINNLLIIIMIVYLIEYKPRGSSDNKRKVKYEQE